MIRITALLALVCGVVPGPAGAARVDFDHGCHFSRYKTFLWAKSPDGQSSDELFPNQLMRERIAGFIEEALAARGLKRVESGGDLLVSYQVKVTEEPIYTTFSNGTGPVGFPSPATPLPGYVDTADQFEACQEYQEAR